MSRLWAKINTKEVQDKHKETTEKFSKNKRTFSKDSLRNMKF